MGRTFLHELLASITTPPCKTNISDVLLRKSSYSLLYQLFGYTSVKPHFKMIQGFYSKMQNQFFVRLKLNIFVLYDFFSRGIPDLLDKQIRILFWSYGDIIHNLYIGFWNPRCRILITFFPRVLMLQTERLWIRLQNFESVYSVTLRSASLRIFASCEERNWFQCSSFSKTWSETSSSTLNTYKERFDNTNTLGGVNDYLFRILVC